MKIKICEENREKIENVLRKSSGKATCRVFDFNDILFAEKLFEARLSKILKKDAKHLVLFFTCAKKMPTAYRYQCFSDSVEIETNGNDFFIVNAERKGSWPLRLSRIYFKKGRDKEREGVKEYLLNEFLKI